MQTEKKWLSSLAVLFFVITAFAAVSFAAEQVKPSESEKSAQGTIEDTGRKTSVVRRTLKPVEGVASGVATIGKGATKLVTDTVEETASGKPVDGTVEGIKKGTESLVDATVKGAYKAATLGHDLKSYEIEPPRASSGSMDLEPSKETSKIKIKF